MAGTATSSLGQAIHSACDQQSLSVRALAKKLKVHHSVVQDYISGDLRISAKLAPKLARILYPTVRGYAAFMRQWEEQDDQHLRERKQRSTRKKAAQKAAQRFYAEVEYFPLIADTAKQDEPYSQDTDYRHRLYGLVPYVQVFEREDTDGDYPIISLSPETGLRCQLGREDKDVPNASQSDHLWLYKDYCKRKHLHLYGLIELAREEVISSPILNPQTYRLADHTLVPTDQIERWQMLLRRAAAVLDQDGKKFRREDRGALRRSARLPVLRWSHSDSRRMPQRERGTICLLRLKVSTQ